MSNHILKGAIPGKAFADQDFIDEAKNNANDPRIARHCYPGGATDQNHDIMPGDTSFGQKNVRVDETMAGEANEIGFVSVAG